MNVVEINNKTTGKINIKLLKSVVENFLKYHQLKSKEISLAFVGDARIKKLNRKYRKKNKITDVLSFTGEDDYLGEIIIDYRQIKRQAAKYGHSVRDELIFILVHGLLHLLGHDDETEAGAKAMEILAEKFIKQKMNVKN